MSDTVPITIHNVPLKFSGSTIYSGGWEMGVWYAYAIAPAKVIDVTPNDVSIHDPAYTRLLYWTNSTEQKTMKLVAQKLFNITMTGNPHWQDSLILVMGAKNGGVPLAQQVLDVRALVEVPRSVQDLVDLHGLSRSFESAPAERLRLD